MTQQTETLEADVTKFQDNFKKIQTEIEKIIVGQKEIVMLTLSAIFAGGHVLLEGAPGLGKTLLVKTIAETLGLSFKRIQFTPDLMPSDITGTQVLSEDNTGKRGFVFKHGPIFANIILADEINRATPKTQSALLEAMEEKQITVLDNTYKLPNPFFVLATQNPIELEGTYTLPEAQLDRFLVKVIVPSPEETELKQILQRTTGSALNITSPIFSPDEGAIRVLKMRELVRKVFIAENLQEVIVRMLSALTPNNQYASKAVGDYVRFGPGPRGAQSIVLLAKTFALLDGRVSVSFDDIKMAIKPALRHRMILNFQADADGVGSDKIIDEVREAK